MTVGHNPTLKSPLHHTYRDDPHSDRASIHPDACHALVAITCRITRRLHAQPHRDRIAAVASIGLRQLPPDEIAARILSTTNHELINAAEVRCVASDYQQHTSAKLS
jgi:hypothetical protein